MSECAAIRMRNFFIFKVMVVGLTFFLWAGPLFFWIFLSIHLFSKKSDLSLTPDHDLSPSLRRGSLEQNIHDIQQEESKTKQTWPQRYFKTMHLFTNIHRIVTKGYICIMNVSFRIYQPEKNFKYNWENSSLQTYKASFLIALFCYSNS